MSRRSSGPFHIVGLGAGLVGGVSPAFTEPLPHPVNNPPTPLPHSRKRLVSVVLGLVSWAALSYVFFAQVISETETDHAARPRLPDRTDF